MKRALVLTILSLALALLGIAVACGSNPITVATIEVGAACEITDAGDAGEICPPGQFCSTATCGSKEGTCETIGADACASSGPECDCYGISYYSACLRQAAHRSRRSIGSCIAPNAMECHTDGDCPVNSSCATIFSERLDIPLPEGGSFGFPDGSDLPDGAIRKLSEACYSIQPNFEMYFGLCWALPADGCPSFPRVEGCDLKCIDECSAIREGGFYFPCLDPADASAN